VLLVEIFIVQFYAHLLKSVNLDCWFAGSVKLGFKELLNKDQIDFKELFTDFQLFYTVNVLLNKELLPIQEMPNLALKGTLDLEN
jgi:hypothetical protein